MERPRSDPGGEREQRRAVPAPSVLRSEVLLVLALSLAASAAYSVLDLLSAPIRGVTVATYGRAGLAYQLLDVATDLVPVALVAHFLARSRESLATIGLDLRRPRSDLVWAVGLAALVGTVGLGVYAAAVQLGLNRAVVPAPPAGHWWTIPVIVLGAARSGLLEETVLGYLLHRLGQLGWRPGPALAAAALLRGCYHLYQGFGGFAGNLALGLLFGRVYQVRGRIMPLVAAHFLIDLVAGLGYLTMRGKVSWLA
jgi:membrane protease YdiL (CAAX protease family)